MSAIHHKIPIIFPALLTVLFFGLPVPLPPAHAAPATQVPLRINAGGKGIGKPGDPQYWAPGSKFIQGGKPYPFGPGHDLRQIDSPGPAQIYETVHHQDHDYRIEGLPAGEYLLRFHFTEAYDTDKRAMDYRVNGKPAINALNILAVTGKVRKAHVVEVTTQLQEGQPLLIECREGSGVDVFEAGIEVIPVNPTRSAMAKQAPPARSPPASEPLSAPTGAAAKIRQATGAQTRLVWLQGSEGYHYTGSGNLTRLMGFDTDDGQGERQIIPQEKSFSKPLLTPDGSGVVYSDRDRKNRHAYFVNWDGSGLRDLGKGFASDVWRDPESGRDWVYLRRGAGGSQDRIVRRRLDKPEVEERVWSHTKNGHQGVPWFQLSADGRRFSNAFPWSHCGLGNLESGKWKRYAGGCWPSIAPDNSYRMFVFSGNHKEIYIYDEGGKNRRTVNIANIPGQQGSKVYFPRWSNDVRFLTVSSPEKHPKAELFLGEFAPDLKSIERWIQVTDNDRADIFGDTWVNPQSSPSAGVAVKRPSAPGTPSAGSAEAMPAAEWPATSEGLVWIWDNGNAQNEAPPRAGEKAPFSCFGQLHGRARLGSHYELLLDGGSFAADDYAGSRIITACKETNSISVEALVESFTAEQTGPARILTLSDSPNERSLTLGQEGGQLVLRMRTGADDPNGTRYQTSIGKLVEHSPVHILLTHRPGETVCYLNGKESFRSDRFGDLKSWQAMPLNLGDEQGGGRDWKGSLQAIAVYNRFIDPQEAARQSTLATVRLNKQKAVEQTVLKAKLVETVPLPTLDEMGTYRRALVENVYQVEEVISGPLPKDTPRIVVNQWVVMDRKALPSAARLEPGFTTTLTLEALSEHPELTGEFRSSDHSEFDAPLFYDVNSHR